MSHCDPYDITIVVPCVSKRNFRGRAWLCDQHVSRWARVVILIFRTISLWQITSRYKGKPSGMVELYVFAHSVSNMIKTYGKPLGKFVTWICWSGMSKLSSFENVHLINFHSIHVRTNSSTSRWNQDTRTWSCERGQREFHFVFWFPKTGFREFWRRSGPRWRVHVSGTLSGLCVAPTPHICRLLTK